MTPPGIWQLLCLRLRQHRHQINSVDRKTPEAVGEGDGRGEKGEEGRGKEGGKWRDKGNRKG